MERLKIASLFCGCGGTDIGISGGFLFLRQEYPKLPVKLVYANDNDPAAARIFNANFKVKCDVRDIREISAAEIPEHDILTGGFPCQSFSIVAQNPPRLGCKDEKGQLFFEMCRMLRKRSPVAFIAENVKGILSANHHQAFPLILREFEKCGYIVSHCLLNAADYGVPQKRERVFIIGIRKSLGRKFYPPDPTHSKDGDLVHKRWAALKSVIIPHKEIPEKYFFSERAHAGLSRSNPLMNKGRAQNIDSVCNTVGAHLAKVSLNSTDPVLKVNGKYRRFTPREVARIQSFPETFNLPGTDSALYRALGNAIPPVLIWHITKQLIDILKKVPAVDTRTPDEKRCYNMARITSKNTVIERILSRNLRQLGFAYKKNVIALPGKPDIVFEGQKVAVFCDSDFWHGKDYPGCVNRIKSNKSFWVSKIKRNIERDEEVNGQLKALGWKVMRFWDDEIVENTTGIVEKIKLAVEENNDCVISADRM